MKINRILKNKIEAKHIFYMVMTVLYVYLIVKGIYIYVTGNGFYNCKLEFILIVICSLITYIVSFFNLDLFNKKSKKISINQVTKNCLLSSSFLSLIITTFLYLLIAYDTIYIDFYNIIPSQPVLSVLGLMFLMYGVLFMILYFIHLHLLGKK